MGVCCASQNIEPNSMVDMSKIENPKPINLNKQSCINSKSTRAIINKKKRKYSITSNKKKYYTRRF